MIILLTYARSRRSASVRHSSRSSSSSASRWVRSSGSESFRSRRTTIDFSCSRRIEARRAASSFEMYSWASGPEPRRPGRPRSRADAGSHQPPSNCTPTVFENRRSPSCIQHPASCVCYPSPVAEAGNPISVEGVHFSRQRLTVEEGVRLEVCRWRPEQETGADPIFFVAGWISLLRGWKPLLERLVTTHPDDIHA